MDFDALQQALAHWPAQPLEPSPDDDAVLVRIARVLAQAECRPADLLPLLRHALMRESARRGQEVPLRVPRGTDWPEAHDYAKHGLRVRRTEAQHLLVEACAWKPDWLGHAGEGDLFADAFAERPSRPAYERSIDPALSEATGFDSYTSPGQRAAIHAVLTAPPRTTLVVVLPTGSGKSLVAQAPPLLAGEGACTVVVVPTISLALDQARQFARLWKQRHPRSAVTAFAWHAGIPEADKQQIKQALRSGRQPILFTSPESVVGSLRMAIHDAAQRGYLKYFVVDEAHLVAQWGDSFRPEFQSLAAYRRALLDVAPGDGFRTVLMTATLTAEALSTVETLFTNGRPAELVGSVYLRTEPRYWFAKAADAQDQQVKVLEILRHAPRPLVLYATEVRKAREWAALLRGQGHERVGLFHGDTGNAERQRLVDAWAADELDIMVATSAFGVGIDKRDVRCVVHACVPESLDRYYQEVGRGGRDGRASAAVTVYTDADLETAHGIAAPALISAGLGLPRWRAMVRHAQPAAGSIWRIDLGTVPPNLHQATDYNRAWNLRTLMLLARAGVVALATEPPSPPWGDDEASTPDLSEEELRRLFDTVLVRFLDPQHQDEALWATRIEQSRQATLDAARAGLQRLERVLAGGAEISQELKALYTLSQPGRRILVSAACSGCPPCRAAGHAARIPPARPLVRPLQSCDEAGLTRWRERFPAQAASPAFILFDPADPALERRLEQLALRLRDCGMRELHASRDEWPTLSKWQVLRQIGSGFVALIGLDEREDELAPVPRLTLLRRADSRALARLEQAGWRPFDWIAVPADTADPHRPDRRLADLRECVRLPAALEILTAWAS